MSAACPVAAIAAELHRVLEASGRIDDAKVGVTGPAYNDLEAQEQALLDRQYALQDAASHQLAVSWPGAMIQLALLLSAVDSLASFAADREEHRVGELERHASRLAHSIMVFMERTSGLSRDDFAGDYYISRDLDPHARVQRAMAE